MKIAIIGYSGAGKSTMAGILSRYYACPLLYLDAVNFKEDWKERKTEEAQTIVKEFMKNENWVIDGNYGALYQSRRLEEADSIIFLNYNRLRCLLQALKRYTVYKGKSRESIAKGCNEKIDFEFIKWIIYEGRTAERRAHYRKIIHDYKQKTVVLRNPEETALFLKKFKIKRRKGSTE